MKLKTTTLSRIRDGKKFKLSYRGVQYEMVKKNKDKTCTYTSCNSGRSFTSPGKSTVIIVND